MMKIRRISNTDDICILFFVSFFVIDAFNLLIQLTVGAGLLWTIVSRSILALLMIYSFIHMLKNKCKYVLCYEIVLVSLFAITFAIGTNSENARFWQIAFTSICVSFPMGICVFYVSDYRRLLETLKKASYFVRLILYLAAILGIAINEEATYEMALGYSILWQSLFSICRLKNDKLRLFDTVIVILDCFFILSFCSRGPMICLAVYLFLRFLTSSHVKNDIKLFVSVLGLGTIGLILGIIAKCGNRIWMFLESRGVTSRTIKLLLTDLLHDSGRNVIYSFYVNKIQQRPLLGYGIAGGWAIGSFPHNIFLEFFLSFGILFGFILIMAVIGLNIHALKKSRNSETELLIIGQCIAFSLLFSGTFTTELAFWICFFMSLSVLIKKKTHVKSWEIEI